MDFEITKALKSFFKSEFNSVASNERRLAMKSFQLYFNYPLLLSQRLFEIFDIESKGYLTKKDYISGFTNVYLGNTHNKINLLFNFFDYNKEGLIYPEDVQLIISYIYSYTERYNDNNKKINNNFIINEQGKNGTWNLIEYSNYKPITIKQLVNFFQSIDSSPFIIFYSFLYSKRTFSQELIYSIGKKGFNKMQFEVSFFQSLLSPSIINQNVDNKTIEYVLKACDVYFDKYLSVNNRKDNEEDDVNEDEEAEADLNDLISFEDDLRSIKDQLIPEGNNIRRASNRGWTLDINTKNASIDLDSLTKKSTQTSLPSISLCRKSSFMTANNSNEDAFIVFLPKKNSQKIAMKVIDKFIVVYHYIEEERMYDRLIPIKCLYIDNNTITNRNSCKSSNDFVQLSSTIIRNCDSSNMTLSFTNQSDKSSFIDLINSITNARNIWDDYSIFSEVSHGKMGDVQIGISKLNQSKVIIKTLHKNSFYNYHWEAEISKFIISNPHKNVIKCYDIYDYSDKVIMIYEYIESGSLFDLFRNQKNTMNSVLVLDIANQMLSGLEYLHSKGILHRDIKPNNILVQEDRDKKKFAIKFIDFGVSQMMFSRQTAKACVGTLLFVAPEIFSNLPYSFGIDLWSLGIVIFYLQFGFMPFSIQQSYSNSEVINCILTKSLSIPSDSSYITATTLEKRNYQIINNIINKTLNKDQSKRQSCKVIKREAYFE